LPEINTRQTPRDPSGIPLLPGCNAGLPIELFIARIIPARLCRLDKMGGKPEYLTQISVNPQNSQKPQSTI